MEQLHAHEVLHMMQGHSYTRETLKQAIIARFGAKQRFYTCSAEGLDADALIDFLEQRGKFVPMDEGFTVDMNKVCSH